VLIVEHDVWRRWTLRAVFEEAGFDVECASNGVAGLRRAVELKPHLIVLGGPLPEMSAVDLAEELRTVHHFSRAQIVTIEEILSGGLPDEAPTDAVAGRRTPSRRWAPLASRSTRMTRPLVTVTLDWSRRWRERSRLKRSVALSNTIERRRSSSRDRSAQVATGH